MSAIHIKSLTYSYISIRDFLLKPYEDGVLDTSNLLKSEFKSLKILADMGKIQISSDDYAYISSKTNSVPEYKQHFRGLFNSYEALRDSITDAIDGDYAHIDGGVGFNRILAIWDSSDNKWLIKEGTVIGSTDEVTEGSNNLYFKSDRVLSIVNPLITPIQNQIGNIDTLLSQILGG